MTKTNTTAMDLVLSGLDSFEAAIKSGNRKLEIDLDKLDHLEFLGFAACLSGFAISRFKTQETARLAFTACLRILIENDRVSREDSSEDCQASKETD